MRKYSVVIPVYNGEKFIKNCYGSLLDQTYEEWEAIFVDDGSSDHSLEEIEALAAKDIRVKVSHQNNRGQIQARYKGIEEAKGEYCLFLDVDDTLKNNTLSDINLVLEKYEAPDIVMFNGEKVNQKTGERFPVWPDLCENEKLYSGKEYNKLRGSVLDGRRLNNICFKAIKSSVLKDNDLQMSFENIRTEEDLLMQLPYFDRAEDLLYIPKKYYIYSINEASVTNTYDPNLFKSACYLYKELMKYGKKWGLENNSERCSKRFLLSTISSVVKDAHYLGYREFTLKLSQIRKNKIFKMTSDKIPNDMPKSRIAYIRMVKMKFDYLCYILGKKKKIVY